MHTIPAALAGAVGLLFFFVSLEPRRPGGPIERRTTPDQLEEQTHPVSFRRRSVVVLGHALRLLALSAFLGLSRCLCLLRRQYTFTVQSADHVRAPLPRPASPAPD
jgi:hypothetical protein